MVEIEIRSVTPLEPAQESLLEMHGLLNILNILSGELQYLGLFSEDEEATADAVEYVIDLCKDLADPELALARLRELDALDATVQAAAATFVQRHPDLRTVSEFQQRLQNLDSLLRILHLRVAEHLARAANPDAWRLFTVDEIIDKLQDMLQAIAKNSKGRYRIVHRRSQQQEGDYLITLAVDSIDGDSVWMPASMQDVIIDLMANARKYTEPGGKITLRLWDDGRHLHFMIQDSGRGIPEDQLQDVVNYGVRGTNVQDKRTAGSGFGLTKAFLTVQRLGGRMWIRSELGQGTRITLWVPLPHAHLSTPSPNGDGSGA